MVSQVIWLKKLRVILHCSSCAVFRTLQNHQQDSKKLKAHYGGTKVKTPCHQWVHSCSAHMPLLRLEHCGAHFLISRPEFFGALLGVGHWRKTKGRQVTCRIENTNTFQTSVSLVLNICCQYRSILTNILLWSDLMTCLFWINSYYRQVWPLDSE